MQVAVGPEHQSLIVCWSVLLPACCVYVFDWAKLYPVLFVGCTLLITSPVLWSICSRVKLVLFSHFCFRRDEVVCVCVVQVKSYCSNSQ